MYIFHLFFLSFFFFSPFLPFFCVGYSGFSCSLQLLWPAHLHPAGSGWGGGLCREKHIVQCRTRLQVGRVWDREDKEGTEDRRDARTGDWVCLEIFLWLQPKISQGNVLGPEAVAARAEPGESIPGMQGDTQRDGGQILQRWHGAGWQGAGRGTGNPRWAGFSCRWESEGSGSCRAGCCGRAGVV